MFRQANDLLNNMFDRAAQAMHINNIGRGLRATLPRDRDELSILVWCPPAYVALRSATAVVDGFYPKPPKPAATQVTKPPANDPSEFKDPMAAE